MSTAKIVYFPDELLSHLLEDITCQIDRIFTENKTLKEKLFDYTLSIKSSIKTIKDRNNWKENLEELHEIKDILKIMSEIIGDDNWGSHAFPSSVIWQLYDIIKLWINICYHIVKYEINRNETN